MTISIPATFESGRLGLSRFRAETEIGAGDLPAARGTRFSRPLVASHPRGVHPSAAPDLPAPRARLPAAGDCGDPRCSRASPAAPPVQRPQRAAPSPPHPAPRRPRAWPRHLPMVAAPRAPAPTGERVVQERGLVFFFFFKVLLL